MMGKRFLLVWVPVGIVLLLLLTILTGYGLAVREKPDLKKARFSVSSTHEVPLGSKAELQLEVTLPVNLPPPACTVEAPANTVAGDVQIRHGRYLWKHNLWILKCPLVAVKPGAATGGKVIVMVKGRFPAEETFDIPDFVIVPVKKTGDQPVLAGPLLEMSQRALSPGVWGAVICGILILGLGIWLWLRWYFMQDKGPVAVPPWVQAELALDRLSIEVEERKMPLGTAFLRLTDVVRKYLEERYLLPVTSRTTDEFMEDLRENSPLPDSDQPFLREFLTSADLIKFAKMPPDEKGIRHALTGAKELIRHTIPTAQEGEGKHHV